MFVLMLEHSRKPQKTDQKRPEKRYRIPTEERLTRQALYYLDRYASSASNLRRVLERKVMRAAASHDRDPAEFQTMIDSVMAKCQRSGVVDDMQYAETKIAGQRRRGRSRRQIEAKLRSKGIAADVLDKAFESDTKDDQTAAVILARRKRIGPWRTRGDRDAFRDKDMAALCRAGYGFDIARRIVDGDADELQSEGLA